MRKSKWAWAVFAIGVVATNDAAAATFAPWQRLHAPQVVSGTPAQAASGAFGQALAISGDHLLVAQPYDDVGAGTDRGSLTAYARVGGSWQRGARLVYSLGSAGDGFGASVAMSGAWAVAINVEHAVLFERLGADWIERQSIAPRAGHVSNREAVAISGDWLAIGMTRESDGAGVVDLYQRSGATWTFRASVSETAGGGAYGYGLALDGDALAVGAPSATIGQPNHGAIYVYRRNGTSWPREATLPNPMQDTAFGYEVALAGDTLVSGDSDGGVDSVGSFRIYQRTGGAWSLAFEALGVEESSAFGDRVAVAGNEAFHADSSGRVHPYTRVGTAWTANATIAPPPMGEHGGFGSALAATTDALVVGVPYAPLDGAPVGRVDVFAAGGSPADIGFARADGSAIAPGTTIAITDAIAGGATSTTLRVTNTGGAALTTLAVPSLPAPFTVSLSASSLPAGGSFVTITIGCDATSTTAASATLTVLSDDADASENPARFPLTCTGVTAAADLGIAVSNGVASLVPDASTRYRIVVGNAGPLAAGTTRVVAALPAGLATMQWSCAPMQMATCTTTGGSGGVDVLADIAMGGAIEITVDATVAANATGFVDFVATADDAALPDPDTSDDRANDRDPVVPDGVFANGFEESSATAAAVLKAISPRAD